MENEREMSLDGERSQGVYQSSIRMPPKNYAKTQRNPIVIQRQVTRITERNMNHKMITQYHSHDEKKSIVSTSENQECPFKM